MNYGRCVDQFKQLTAKTSVHRIAVRMKVYDCFLLHAYLANGDQKAEQRCSHD
jgi:hypothetical protein